MIHGKYFVLKNIAEEKYNVRVDQKMFNLFELPINPSKFVHLNFIRKIKH